VAANPFRNHLPRLSATSASDGVQHQRLVQSLSPFRRSFEEPSKDPNNRPVFAATVAFYDAGGNEVGRSTSSANGSIYASVPTSAVTFHVLTSSLSPTFYQSYYVYNFLGYSTLIPTCRARSRPLRTVSRRIS